jgi:hypothetical protein
LSLTLSIMSQHAVCVCVLGAGWAKRRKGGGALNLPSVW